jgi:DNA-binding protein HU-beta
MGNNIDKNELVKRISRRLKQNEATVEPVVDAMMEEIYEALKREEGVSLRNFGTFYIDVRRSGTVFKFNPSQRLRALFGWSSTYKGDIIMP